MIRKVGNEYCVFSHKGKNLGCYSSKEEAQVRLKQIEYFKHVKSEDENPFNELQKPTDGKPPLKKKKKKNMAEIKNPNSISVTNVNHVKTVTEDRKVPEVKLPSLKTIKAADGTITLAPEGKAEANRVIQNIDDQMGRMKDMKKLCERMMTGGISGEEYSKLDSYIQEELLRAMHQNGCKAMSIDPRVMNELLKNRKAK
jgi:hypothetical protein